VIEKEKIETWRARATQSQAQNYNSLHTSGVKTKTAITGIRGKSQLSK
jgi:hypothetical protein